MRKSGVHDLIERDREVADAFASGVVDGIRDGGGCSRDADFADAAGSERVEPVVGDVKCGNVDLVDVGVDGNVVLGEIFVDSATVGVVDEGLFMKGHADAPDDSAGKLIDACGVVDEGADVVGADHASNLDHVGVSVYGNLGKDRSPRVRTEGVAVFGHLAGGGGFDGRAAVAGEQGGDRFGFSRIGFEIELAVFGFELFGCSSVER